MARPAILTERKYLKGIDKLSNTDDRRINLCLASPLFYPTYGGSQLRFLRYLPGLKARGIDVRVVSGTPSAEDVTQGNSAGDWSRYPAGTILPEEIVNGAPLMRVRLPDSGGCAVPSLTCGPCTATAGRTDRMSCSSLVH